MTIKIALIIAITILACDVHLCTISFDLWAPRYHFKTFIYGRQKSADSDSDAVKKFADSDANSESITTLHLSDLTWI